MEIWTQMQAQGDRNTGREEYSRGRQTQVGQNKHNKQDQQAGTHTQPAELQRLRQDQQGNVGSWCGGNQHNE